MEKLASLSVLFLVVLMGVSSVYGRYTKQLARMLNLGQPCYTDVALEIEIVGHSASATFCTLPEHSIFHSCVKSINRKRT